MIITNLTANDYWFGPMHLAAGSGQQLILDDTSDTSLYLLNDEVADAVNTLYLASNIAVSSAATPFPRATGTPSLLHGDGSPEGLVYAPQGSLYLRRDTVSPGTSLYSKQTGVTQNTGWAPIIAPAGDLIPSAASSRVGCLLCDGTSYARASYPVLFAAIGTTYGSVDGSHFNVPDLRGRLPLGAGTGTGAGATAWSAGQQPTSGAGGEQTHTLAVSEMPSHSHVDSGHTHGIGSGGSTYALNSGGGIGTYSAGAYGFGWTQGTNSGAAAIQNTGGGGAHNILPPVSVVNWFIVHG
jgi:microcystin-dependent protein